jgi:hypothetical protein
VVRCEGDAVRAGVGVLGKEGATGRGGVVGDAVAAIAGASATGGAGRSDAATLPEGLAALIDAAFVVSRAVAMDRGTALAGNAVGGADATARLRLSIFGAIRTCRRSICSTKI